MSGVAAQGCAVARFHNRMVASLLPEARVCPSGLNATLYTVPVWPAGAGPAGPGGRVGEIPEPHGGIVAAGDQGVPVGAKRHAVHDAGVALQGLAQRGRVRRIGEIPQPHGGIILPEARVCPSGLNATLYTAQVHGLGVGHLQGRAQRARVGRVGQIPQPDGGSSPLEARVCPSGLNATLHTVTVWPVRGWPSGPGGPGR